MVLRGSAGQADVEKLDVGKDVGGNADGSKFALNGDGGGEDPIMEEGSKTDPGIRTHSPFGIAVVDIAHEGLGLDSSVDFNGDGGRFEPYRACETPSIDVLGEVVGGIADTDFLVSPFHLGRKAIFEGVAKSSRKTSPSLQCGVVQLTSWVVWENG